MAILCRAAKNSLRGTRSMFIYVFVSLGVLVISMFICICMFLFGRSILKARILCSRQFSKGYLYNVHIINKQVLKHFISISFKSAYMQFLCPTKLRSSILLKVKYSDYLTNIITGCSAVRDVCTMD
jgi:hypothetical protein